MFLYKLYNITFKHERPKIPEFVFIQEEIDNLEKTLKTLQSPVKMISFYLLPYYKTLQKHREQYWKEIAIEFIKQKHNANTRRQGFYIKILIEGPLHEPFFIALTL